jgi:hypothetical protein
LPTGLKAFATDRASREHRLVARAHRRIAASLDDDNESTISAASTQAP